MVIHALQHLSCARRMRGRSRLLDLGALWHVACLDAIDMGPGVVVLLVVRLDDYGFYSRVRFVRTRLGTIHESWFSDVAVEVSTVSIASKTSFRCAPFPRFVGEKRGCRVRWLRLSEYTIFCLCALVGGHPFGRFLGFLERLRCAFERRFLLKAHAYFD